MKLEAEGCVQQWSGRNEIHYCEFPPDRLAEISRLMALAAEIAPDWVLNIYVHNCAIIGDRDKTLTVQTSPQYRQLIVSVHRNFWEDPVLLRLFRLAHEMFHAHLEDLANVIEELVAATTEEASGLRVFANDRKKAAEERAVQDLAAMWMRLRGRRLLDELERIIGNPQQPGGPV